MPSARQEGHPPELGDDTCVAADANVTNTDATGEAVQQPAQPPAGPVPAAQQRVWSMPKSPVTRKHVDNAGRVAITVIRSIAGFVAGAARYGAGVARQMWRGVEAVPPAAKLLCGSALLMLLGLVGAITADSSLGLICTVVVVPVCAGILGALGYRWYSGLGLDEARRTESHAEAPDESELQRSVQYVDRKLTLALTSFGTEHHQQAVIALFQAKTAVELTLGTEQDLASYGDITLRADDYGLRPRIRAGSGPAATPRDGNSLAAS